MSKSIIENSTVLPSIDEQIEYIHSLRLDIVKHVKNGLDMILAIEQSLLAAKLNLLSGNPDERFIKYTDPNDSRQSVEILASKKIKPTLLRLDVLSAILMERDQPFTVTDLRNRLSTHSSVSRTSIIKTLILFKEENIIGEVKANNDGQRRNGRPENRYKLNGV